MFEIWEAPQWVQQFYAVTNILSLVFVIALIVVIVVIAIFSFWQKENQEKLVGQHIRQKEADVSKNEAKTNPFTTVSLLAAFIVIFGTLIVSLIALNTDQQFSGEEYNNPHSMPEIDWRSNNEKVVFDEEEFSQLLNDELGWSDVDISLHQRYIYDTLVEDGEVPFIAIDKTIEENSDTAEIYGVFHYSENELIVELGAEEEPQETISIPLQ